MSGERRKKRSGFFSSAITCGFPLGAKSGVSLIFTTVRWLTISSRDTGWLNVTVATVCWSEGVAGST